MGTDDYMVKPINMNEMVLRVEALLRRAKIANEHKLKVGEVTLDYDALTVTAKDKVYELPKKEFYLLFKLLSYPKKIFTRQQLMDEIWGMDVDIDERTVDSHIKKTSQQI
ncbi:Heme response regulator HssR [bioreactor metagenome]|uniref:Heme response regulator HssR n=1 Tax=bioreactor metagenome TaxID=1076179 RepID=A0A645GEU9_9ZZZZ